MTQTPSPEPIEPIVVTTFTHRILWSITPVKLIQSYQENLHLEGGELRHRDEFNPFPNTGVLPPTDITPDFNKILSDIDPYYIIQPRITVTGKVQRVRITNTTRPGEGTDEEVTETDYFFEDVPYRLNGMTITSTHEENKVWIFPDDFSGASAPEGTPKEYGGVILENAEPVPVEKKAGELSSCGSNGNSGYQYLDVFYNFDFRYIPRNSVRLDSPGTYEDKDVVNSRDRFPTKPRLPFVEDEDGLKAPIMPIDMVITTKVTKGFIYHHIRIF